MVYIHLYMAKKRKQKRPRPGAIWVPPDVLDAVRERASENKQTIGTVASDILADALSDKPTSERSQS
jgi:hypothetical protein